MTFMKHCAPSDLDANVGELNSPYKPSKTRLSNSNLLLHAKKTKQMMIYTEQMSRVHKLDDQLPQVSANGKF